jgi:sugar lactone lactonase YvrE
LNPDTREVIRILEVPWSGAGLVGGPGESAFVPAYDMIWQVQPDGSYTVWGRNPGPWPKNYTEDGRLLVAVYNDPTSVYELHPDGSLTKVAGGFSTITDIVASPDGTLFVSDNENQTITRINPDGTRLVLARNVVYRDPMDLGFDPSGQLYLNGGSPNKLSRVDPKGGGLTTMPVDMTQCTIHPADFVFINNSRVVAIDPTWGTLVWGDISTGEVGVFVSNDGANTRASGIGPSDIFYVGVDGCKGNPAGRILAIDPDGNKTIYLNNLPNHIHDMTITSDGGMYIKASDDYSAPSSLYYVPPGGGSVKVVQGGNAVGLSQITALPNGNVLGWFHRTNRLMELSPEGSVKEYTFYPPEAIEAFSMSMGPDGFLYGMAELARNGRRGPIVYRQLLRLDLATGETKVLYENDFHGALAGGTMTAGPDGTLWAILFPDSEIYRVLPDGTAELFAENLPIDTWTIRTNSAGTVYVTSPGGIYCFYQKP